MTLALPLLAGAGLMINSFVRLSQVDPGLDPSRVMTMSLALPRLRYPEAVPDVTRFYDEALRRVGSLPGVQSAAVTSNLPLDSSWGSNDYNLERHPTPPGGSAVARVIPASFRARLLHTIMWPSCRERHAGWSPVAGSRTAFVGRRGGFHCSWSQAPSVSQMPGGFPFA